MEKVRSFWLFPCLCCLSMTTLCTAMKAQAEDVQSLNLAWHILDDEPRFGLVIEDNVADGCWTSTAESKELVEAEIVRAGGDHEAQGRPLATIRIIGNGYDLNAPYCAVVAEVSVDTAGDSTLRSEDLTLTSPFTYTIWRKAILLTGPKEEMSNRVNEAHLALAQSFLDEMALKAQEVRNEVLEGLREEEAAIWRPKLLKETTDQ